MCGIFGVVSNNNIVTKLVNGIKFLEYRGYDSSGVSVIDGNKIKTLKKVGKVTNLEASIKRHKLKANIGIIHTRWATHGKPNETNAHPHNSSDGLISVVHNAIIENYKELKNDLIKKGYSFKSLTDTEVIPNLISYFLKQKNNYKDSILKTINKLEGSFALGIIFKNDPEHIYCTRRNSPLLIGIGKNENYISSGLSAFTGITNKIINLEEDDFAIISNNDYQIFNNKGKIVKRKVETINIDNIDSSKGSFKHYMLKEIFEEPRVIQQTIKEYVDTKNKKILLPKFNFDLSKVKEVNFISCGTSYYASYIAKYFIEDIAKIKVNIDVASEFRYKNQVLNKNDISIFISQSGETADTLAALKLCKENGQKIVSIVNVLQSKIASLSDIVLKTLAGIEVGVAATKSLVGQLIVIYLFSIELALSKKTITKKEYEKYINELLKFDKIIKSLLENKNWLDNIKNISKKVKKNNFFIFSARGIYYPVALEGALKLKEISYIPCEGIASGELKHGPIALIDKNTYLFIINPTNNLFNKTSSNIEEIYSRDGKIVLISDKKGIDTLKNKIESSIEIKETDNQILSVLMSLLSLQLLSYYISRERGNDIDKPRNLAKSVTVE